MPPATDTLSAKFSKTKESGRGPGRATSLAHPLLYPNANAKRGSLAKEKDEKGEVMSVQKKSLISQRSAVKKAIIASPTFGSIQKPALSSGAGKTALAGGKTALSGGKTALSGGKTALSGGKTALSGVKTAISGGKTAR